MADLTRSANFTGPYLGSRPVLFDDDGPRIEVGMGTKIQFFGNGSGTRDGIYFQTKGYTTARQELFGRPFDSYEATNNVYKVTDTGTSLTVAMIQSDDYYCYTAPLNRRLYGCIHVNEDGSEAPDIEIHDEHFGIRPRNQQITLSWVGKSAAIMEWSFVNDSDQAVALFTTGATEKNTYLSRRGDVFTATINSNVPGGLYRIKYGSNSTVRASINVKKVR